MNIPQSTGIAGTSSGSYESGSQLSGSQNYGSTTSNTYSPGAAATQQGGNDLLQALLTGGAGGQPPNMGITPEAYSRASDYFNENIATKMATQFGAGSPAIPAAEMRMLRDLSVEDSQMSWDNTFQLLDQISKIGYEPTGASTSGYDNRSQNSAEAGNYDSKNIDIGGILTGLFSGLGGGFFP